MATKTTKNTRTPYKRAVRTTPGKAIDVLPFPMSVKIWQAGLIVLGILMCGFIIWRAYAESVQPPTPTPTVVVPEY
ncbi:MAG: hypothetical protein WCI47_02975 [bacterium]